MGDVVDSVFGAPKPKEDKELKARQEAQLAREERREAENDARLKRQRAAFNSRSRGRRLLIAAESGELGVDRFNQTLGGS